MAQNHQFFIVFLLVFLITFFILKTQAAEILSIETTNTEGGSQDSSNENLFDQLNKTFNELIANVEAFSFENENGYNMTAILAGTTFIYNNLKGNPNFPNRKNLTKPYMDVVSNLLFNYTSPTLIDGGNFFSKVSWPLTSATMNYASFLFDDQPFEEDLFKKACIHTNLNSVISSMKEYLKEDKFETVMNQSKLNNNSINFNKMYRNLTAEIIVISAACRMFLPNITDTDLINKLKNDVSEIYKLLKAANNFGRLEKDQELMSEIKIMADFFENFDFLLNGKGYDFGKLVTPSFVDAVIKFAYTIYNDQTDEDSNAEVKKLLVHLKDQVKDIQESLKEMTTDRKFIKFFADLPLMSKFIEAYSNLIEDTTSINNHNELNKTCVDFSQTNYSGILTKWLKRGKFDNIMKKYNYSDEIYNKIHDLYKQNTKIYIAMVATCGKLKNTSSKEELKSFAENEIANLENWMNFTNNKRLDNYWPLVKGIAEMHLKNETSNDYYKMAGEIYEKIKKIYDSLGFAYAVYVAQHNNKTTTTKPDYALSGNVSNYDYMILRTLKNDEHSSSICRYLDKLSVNPKEQGIWCVRYSNYTSLKTSLNLKVFDNEITKKCGGERKRILISSPSSSVNWGYLYDSSYFEANSFRNLTLQQHPPQNASIVEECYGTLDVIYTK